MSTSVAVRPSRVALVGRDRELAMLTAGLEDALGGRGHLYVLSGEPGAGKTRLLEEVAAAAAARNAQVLWGRCWEREGAPPFWPWERVLGAVLQHPDTAASLNNLGALLEAQGDYAAARSYLEQTLTIRKKVLGEQHPATATSLNNLGLLLHTQGDYAAVRPYIEQALAIQRRSLDRAAAGSRLGCCSRRRS